MAKHDATQWYGSMFKAWPKQAGSKPSAELLDTVHKLGARPGKQAMANAMYLRPEGASQSQVVMVCGAPQLNKMRQLRDSHKVVRQIPHDKNEAGHTVYRIELTAKGASRVKGAAEVGADTPAKAKPKAKRTPKAKPVTVDTGEATATPVAAVAEQVTA